MAYCLVFAFWLLLCTALRWDTVLLGLGFLLGMLLLSARRARVQLPLAKRLRLCRLLLRFILRFLRELIEANVAILADILSPRRVAESKLVFVRCPLRQEETRALLANLISLTPGTLTVAVEEGGLHIHALHKGFAKGLENPILLHSLIEMEVLADAAVL